MHTQISNKTLKHRSWVLAAGLVIPLAYELSRTCPMWGIWYGLSLTRDFLAGMYVLKATFADHA